MDLAPEPAKWDAANETDFPFCLFVPLRNQTDFSIVIFVFCYPRCFRRYLLAPFVIPGAYTISIEHEMLFDWFRLLCARDVDSHILFDRKNNQRTKRKQRFDEIFDKSHGNICNSFQRKYPDGGEESNGANLCLSQIATIIPANPRTDSERVSPQQCN